MIREREYPDLADASWSRLRLAIAEEYISKLPTSMSIEELSSLLRMPERDVRGRIRTGEIIARTADAGLRIIPGDNTAFLRRDMLLHLPLPEPRRPRTYPNEFVRPIGSVSAAVS